jgi:hypothetical protein
VAVPYGYLDRHHPLLKSLFLFENIRKFLTYVLVHNVAELIPYLGFLLFKIPLSESFSLSGRRAMLGDTWETASTMRPHSMPRNISVESAVDGAKEAAGIVLLEKDLGVLVRGVREGRTTFANTLKYVFMATSANFVKHVQHGRSIAIAPVSPVAAQADFAHQSTNRFSGDHDRDRQRGQRNGGPSSALGHQSHSQVYDDDIPPDKALCLTTSLLVRFCWLFMQPRINSEPDGFWSPCVQRHSLC